jgi:hypothetical protein
MAPSATEGFIDDFELRAGTRRFAEAVTYFLRVA